MRVWWTLARPRLAPAVLLLPFLGWLWAHWDYGLDTRHPVALLGVMLGWWFLHAGTLWINAARDQDHGPVLLGEAVRVPDHAVRGGIIALVIGVIICSFAQPVSGAWALWCAVLAWAYSARPLVLKAHPIGGPLVNVLGYGVASPAAGWATVGVYCDPRTILAWSICLLGVLGAYFVAQAFQEDEDRARGDRTLVATHGPRIVLTAARVCFGLGYAVAAAMMLAGWLPRICLLSLPTAFWVDAHLRRSSNAPAGGGATAAVVTGQRLLFCAIWVCLLASIPYVRDSFRGGPVAGLATVAGHPPVPTTPHRFKQAPQGDS